MSAIIDSAPVSREPECQTDWAAKYLLKHAPDGAPSILVKVKAVSQKTRLDR